MSKVKCRWITGVGIIEMKDIQYVVSFINDLSKKEYVFLVPKLLIDKAMEERVINDFPTNSMTTKEIEKIQLKEKGSIYR